MLAEPVTRAVPRASRPARVGRGAARLAGLWLLALLTVCGPGEAAAQAGGARSADEAAAMAQARTGGRVLGVSSQGGRYLVKVLTAHGRVRVVAVPAAR